ncbi:LrgB family protein [Bacillus sp. FJAT-44742]|uniref:LrgB family protein n=1 Tax=Bacillus sp. FJAT-44742 TaxID=2014005 RepID=UPI000C248F0C|nr:LrgB family protein [Bacillus sp. FJAT-44742]
MNEWWISLIAVAATLGTYRLGISLYRMLPSPFMLPLLSSTFLIVIFLLITDISYDTYMIGGQWIESLLGPAIVALAYPLYKQAEMLKKYFWPIIGGVLLGAFVGILSGIYLARLFGIEEFLLFSLVPKSVTTPVAMEVAASIGGAPPLAAVFVMVAGIGGVVLSGYLFKLCKIDHFLGKGIGLGAASHAIGTAKALENNEKEGAASSIAMTLSAVVVSILAPLIISFLY